jgi:hypothetical protein
MKKRAARGLVGFMARNALTFCIAGFALEVCRRAFGIILMF